MKLKLDRSFLTLETKKKAKWTKVGNKRHLHVHTHRVPMTTNPNTKERSGESVAAAAALQGEENEWTWGKQCETRCLLFTALLHRPSWKTEASSCTAVPSSVQDWTEEKWEDLIIYTKLIQTLNQATAHRRLFLAEKHFYRVSRVTSSYHKDINPQSELMEQYRGADLRL